MALQLDVSSLVGGGGGGVDLNDTLSAVNPQNSSVFSKPFGDKTVWCTPSGGAVCVAFLFDPNQRWGERHIVASITTDWPTAIRAALARQLLPEPLVTQAKFAKPNLQHATWRALTSTLPSKAFEQYLLSRPEKLVECVIHPARLIFQE
jgi:hypothetical protein